MSSEVKVFERLKHKKEARRKEWNTSDKCVILLNAPVVQSCKYHLPRQREKRLLSRLSGLVVW